MVNGLGERLQKSRTVLKLSQKEVANSLNVSPAVISNYEKGERTPSVEMLMALARLYHCSTDYLLGFEKDNPSLLMFPCSPINRQHFYKISLTA